MIIQQSTKRIRVHTDILNTCLMLSLESLTRRQDYQKKSKLLGSSSGAPHPLLVWRCEGKHQNAAELSRKQSMKRHHQQQQHDNNNEQQEQ
mmetsp:Transcript_33683/g.51661  ORF Transcript_33683/g.51661 Transcript_33683/m.51661 type:complete len:91 (-) Transcript_33683:96-368(-)